MWDVGNGKITIGGRDIREIPLEQLNQNIAYVAQDNFLFNESVRENIRKGNLSATDEEVENIAKASGCHEFIMKLENGYDTIVGSSGGHLSGGERQRIAIARAMLKNAPIVILDEATAYTDPEKGKFWAKRCEGMTIYTAEQLAAFLGKAGFSDIKIHKTRKVWCAVEGIKP